VSAPDRALPEPADDLALAALLLAVERGGTFTDRPLRQIRENIAATELSTRKLWVWIERLVWDLCAEATTASPSDSGPVQLLTATLDHDDSSIRGWCLKLAWMVRPWLRGEDAVPRLLTVLANTLGNPLLAGALAAEFFPDPELFWLAAEEFDPPRDFESQYRERVETLREHGIVQLQLPFFVREARCRKLIEDAAFEAVPHRTGGPVARTEGVARPSTRNITREEARAIAEEFLSHSPVPLDGNSIGEVHAVPEAGSLSIYGAPVEECWIAYVNRPFTGIVRSSTVLLISRRTGKVVYAGSANDEG